MPWPPQSSQLMTIQNPRSLELLESVVQCKPKERRARLLKIPPVEEVQNKVRVLEHLFNAYPSCPCNELSTQSVYGIGSPRQEPSPPGICSSEPEPDPRQTSYFCEVSTLYSPMLGTCSQASPTDFCRFYLFFPQDRISACANSLSNVATNPKEEVLSRNRQLPKRPRAKHSEEGRRGDKRVSCEPHGGCVLS